MKNIKTFFVCLFVVTLVAVLNSCEPLDSDSQGQQDQQADTAQAQDSAKQQAQAPGSQSMASRLDSLGDELSQTNDRVGKIQEELDAVKDLMQTQGGGVTDPEQAYKQGLDQFFSRQYEQSASSFQQLLDAGKPEALQSNCQYWIGENLYGMHKYAEAIEAFKKVYSYSSSTKFDDAQMMIGESYLRLGNRARARAAFEQLIKKYPESEYVPRAKKILARI